ncbi:RNA-binding domain-containing protein [Macrolepiota fuliginosa MF-IS2]|uniref:RNA-binding domain-containing protein n=1 Tax=Macrolepiota fuliginosa MF-IS2 TaxID=1400762 RepID=A0A9P5XF13_9AGAR|nr:RNA-binding domain-containing protein [Macrolepiota fuliginosa MF-IS2]
MALTATTKTKTQSKGKKLADDKSPPSTTKQTKTKQQAKVKEKSPSPAALASDGEDGEEEQAEGEVEEEASGDDHLHGFSTDEDDSSDEDEEVGEDKPGLSAFEISKLPTVAKDDESVKRRLEKAKRQPTEDRGVVYIGRLPHGFYEEQLKGYFSQFGNITRLRISRNKKTGKCKHYGFIEFDSSSVAQIVAETMDNYLLSGHILKCRVIPKDEVHPELWIGANRKWRVVPRDRIVRVQHNKSRTEEERIKSNKRLIKRQNERKRKLETLGIDYDFDAVGYVSVSLVYYILWTD